MMKTFSCFKNCLLLLALTASFPIGTMAAPAQAQPLPNENPKVICGRELGDMVPQPESFLLWLPSGAKSLPDLRLLRQGDGLVIKAHTANEALQEVKGVQQKIKSLGGVPQQFKYIVRTFPSDLVPDPSASNAEVPFFAAASSAELQELQALVFAIMFDHERVWYDRDPDRLPPWSWDYRWTLKQVKQLAGTINAQCIPSGVLVTPSSKREGKWTDPYGRLMQNGFAKLLETPVTGLSYLIVQAQPRCREDSSGLEYGDFAQQLNSELEAVFPRNFSKKKNMAMQISIDDQVHPGKGANYVPPVWAEKCLSAANTGPDSSNRPISGNKSINGFFIWSASRTATCDTLKRFRGQPDVSCQ